MDFEYGTSVDEGEIETLLPSIRANPAMDAAMRASVGGALAYFHENPVLHRNVRDVGRLILCFVALYLDATGGLTHRRLRALSGQTGVISAGTATAVLFRMRAIGYVDREEGSGTGVQRRYVPTPEMVETFRRRLRIELGSAALVVDGLNDVLARLDEPEVFRTLVAELGQEVIHAARNPRADLDPINKLSVRTAGILILWDIIRAAEQPGALFASEAEVEISVAALAKRYQVSRSHVLSILRDLSEAGYLERLSRDGLWLLKPELREALLTFFAIIYLGVGRVVGQAKVRLSEALGD